MKKIFCALGLICALALWSCVADDGTQTQGQEEQQQDSISEQTLDEPIDVEGIAVDGAMNSVYLKVGEDTVEFSYPDLDSDNRDSWDINDSLKVRYVETENGDSVIQVINKSE